MSVSASRLHEKAFVVDGLCHSKLGAPLFARMRAGGVTAMNWTAVDVELLHGLDLALQDLVRARNIIDRNPEHLQLGDSLKAIEEAKATGKTAIILGLQSPKPIDDNLAYIRVLKEMGIRIFQLTYNERCYLGDGCTEPKKSGLSQFGIAAVHELNRLGILIDLSHCGWATTAEAIEVSAKPVAITHSNPFRLCPSPRNKPDEIIQALAKKGGVFGICAWSPISYRDPAKRPTLTDLVDAVAYVADLVGDTEHVGIGTDHGEDAYTRDQWECAWGARGLYPSVTGTLGEWYGFDTRSVQGMESISCFPRLTEALLTRGFSDSAVLGILGANFMRLFGEVW